MLLSFFRTPGSLTSTGIPKKGGPEDNAKKEQVGIRYSTECAGTQTLSARGYGYQDKARKVKTNNEIKVYIS